MFQEILVEEEGSRNGKEKKRGHRATRFVTKCKIYSLKCLKIQKTRLESKINRSIERASEKKRKNERETDIVCFTGKGDGE